MPLIDTGFNIFDHTFSYAGVIWTICIVAGLIVVLPVPIYLATYWVRRRDNLLELLSENSTRLYYKRFQLNRIKAIEGISCQQQFRKDFHRLYGRRYYILPLLLLLILTSLLVYSAANTLLVWSHVTSHSDLPMSGIAASAFAGAFVWVIGDIQDRFRRRDITAGDVYGHVFRILLAAPFGWAIAQFAKDYAGIPLAFLVGAFPTQTLFKISRRLADQKLGLADEPDKKQSELEKLQSIGKPAAERFAEEGIEMIVQLAYADPVDLTIRTNFDFAYVIDCASQALLWIYFEENTKKLYKFSLRGAQEAGNLWSCCKKEEFRPTIEQLRQHLQDVIEDESLQLEIISQLLEAPLVSWFSKKEMKQRLQSLVDDQVKQEKIIAQLLTLSTALKLQQQEFQEAQKVLEDAAHVLDISKDSLLHTLDEVAGDPYTEFLRTIWAEIDKNK